MHSALIQAAVAAAAATAIVMSPFGRRTLREVGRDGLMLRHARHLVQIMVVVGLLAVAVAAVNAR